jgi:hypothetical protein
MKKLTVPCICSIINHVSKLEFSFTFAHEARNEVFLTLLLVLLNKPTVTPIWTKR